MVIIKFVSVMSSRIRVKRQKESRGQKIEIYLKGLVTDLN